MYIFNPGGDCHMKGSGVLVGNFELNLLGRPTWAWAILLLIPKRDKFQHSWLNKRSMSFCVTTEMWLPVHVEGEGLFCLLYTSNPQNKSKVFNKEPCKRFRPGEFEGSLPYVTTYERSFSGDATESFRVSKNP